MARRRRSIKRLVGIRAYRKLFIISAEGSKTEQQYFLSFNSQNSAIKVRCLKTTSGNSPNQVLKRMKNYIKKEGLQNTDEAWLVVDKDSWTDEQLSELFAWSEKEDNYGFALSNPKFEIWLLFHFEEGKRVDSSKKCQERLRKHIPDYDKGLDMRTISQGMISDAIRIAKDRDAPPCDDWPRKPGVTTVYRLVESILNTC